MLQAKQQQQYEIRTFNKFLIRHIIFREFSRIYFNFFDSYTHTHTNEKRNIYTNSKMFNLINTNLISIFIRILTFLN